MQKLTLLATLPALAIALPASRLARACEHGGIEQMAVDLGADTPELRAVAKAYKRWAKGNSEAVAALVAADASWSVDGPAAVPFAGEYAGKEGVEEYFEALEESTILQQLDSRYVVAQDGIIHVHLFEVGIAKPTGKLFEMEIVHSWTVTPQGRITRFREYNDSWAMAQAFDPAADPSASLVQNTADYDLPESDYPNALLAALGLYAAFGAGDLPTFLNMTADDVVWILIGPSSIVPFSDTYIGPSGIAEFFFRVFSDAAFLDFGVDEIIVDGSRVDARFHETLYIYGTGKTATSDGLHAMLFDENGKLKSFRSYPNTYGLATAHLPN